MNDTVSLGRIFGIRVGLNWTVLALVVLLVWTLSAGVFPETNPGLGGGTHLAMALAAAVLFAVSILLHELGHAVQARRDGMTIDGITLWAFGGVARFVGMFPSAGAEFRIAIAGPLVSLALGIGFAGLALVEGTPEAVDGVAAWLGYINIVLLVFNLLPALPLDGGRVLRSAIWQATGDFVRATRIASSLARVLAIGLIALGLAATLFMGTVGGLWTAFIGWFLLQAAQSENRVATAMRAMQGRRVSDVMVRDPVTVDASWPLDAVAAQVALDGRYTSYPVVSGGRAAGLLPLGRLSQVPRERWAVTPVAAVMLPRESVAVVAADEPLDTAVDRLQSFAIQRALVVDGERLAGLLSVTDVVRLVRSGQAPPAPAPPA